MRRAAALGCAVAALAAGGLLAVASPAHAASEGAWTVTALFSKPGWTTTKAKPAAVLKACRTGTGGSKFALGTPITVRAGNEAVLGSAPVTQVKLWKEGGRYICKFIATVPVAANTESMFFVQVATQPERLLSRGDLRADKWTAIFWPL